MMKRIIIFYFIFTPLQLVCPMGEQSNFPIGLCVIPEMEYIPELDDWSSYDDKKDILNISEILALIKMKYPFLKKELTPDLIKSISRYAKKEMNTYQTIPPLDTIKFLPKKVSSDGFKIVFEGIVDTLPSHSPIVTRWLKVFIVYNRATHSVIKAIITVRGELLE